MSHLTGGVPALARHLGPHPFAASLWTVLGVSSPRRDGTCGPGCPPPLMILPANSSAQLPPLPWLLLVCTSKQFQNFPQ